MKGLELARRYWLEVGEPALTAACPQAMERAAVGLVGEGSECLGYDDALSRDHDWGPGFCVWLSRDDLDRWGEALRAAYDALPKTFLGYARLREDPLSAGRVGVLEQTAFYRRFLGLDRPPEGDRQWFLLSDQALSVCTNGAVFRDGTGAFTAFRTALLAYYPEEVRRKKLAARCALMAQAGQYNYPRCLRRGDRVAALRALGEFVDHAQGAIFLLNRRYRPYYKWAHRALTDLPLLGREAGERFEALAQEGPARGAEQVEALCGLVAAALEDQGLCPNQSDFLLDHARSIQEGLADPWLRSLPLMLAGA